MIINLKKIILTSLYIALFVVLSIYGTINLQGIKFTLQNFPLIVGAITLGAFPGAFIGFAGMLLNQVITYGFTPTTIVWVLPHTIFGLVLGFIFEKEIVKVNSGIKFWGCIIILQLILTVLNTIAYYIDSVIFGYYNFVIVFGMLIIRLIISVLLSIIYCCILSIILKEIKKIH